MNPQHSSSGSGAHSADESPRSGRRWRTGGVRPPRAPHGLTLVELLAAITITAIIAASTGVLMRQGSAARRQAERELEARAEARAAMRSVLTALRNAYRPFGHQDQAMEGVDDVAEGRPADQVTFATISRRAIRPSEPESDVRRVAFFLSRGDNEPLPSLIRRTDPTRNEPPDEGGVLERIAHRVIAFDVSYYTGLEWVDEWPARPDAWPAIVRVSLAVAGDDQGGHVVPMTRLAHFPGKALTVPENFNPAAAQR